MSSIARIVKDQDLSSTESLALLAVTTDDETIEYVAIVSNSGGSISFRAAEKVTELTKTAVFMRRGFMNGNRAEDVVNPKEAVNLDSRKIKFEKTCVTETRTKQERQF